MSFQFGIRFGRVSADDVEVADGSGGFTPLNHSSFPGVPPNPLVCATTSLTPSPSRSAIATNGTPGRLSASDAHLNAGPALPLSPVFSQ